MAYWDTWIEQSRYWYFSNTCASVYHNKSKCLLWKKECRFCSRQIPHSQQSCHVWSFWAKKKCHCFPSDLSQHFIILMALSNLLNSLGGQCLSFILLAHLFGRDWNISTTTRWIDILCRLSWYPKKDSSDFGVSPIFTVAPVWSSQF